RLAALDPFGGPPAARISPRPPSRSALPAFVPGRVAIALRPSGFGLAAWPCRLAAPGRADGRRSFAVRLARPFGRRGPVPGQPAPGLARPGFGCSAATDRSLAAWRPGPAGQPGRPVGRIGPPGEFAPFVGPCGSGLRSASRFVAASLAAWLVAER